MTFYCSQCGECCTNLGLVHTIEEQTGKHSFTVRNEYTGERTYVMVDSDKYDLFADRSVFDIYPDSCPFLRFKSDGKGYCTCHLTRPEICQDYGCWRILILDSYGNRAGRVMERRHFSSENDNLTTLWKKFADDFGTLSDEEWDRAVIGLLKQAGYQLIR